MAELVIGVPGSHPFHGWIPGTSPAYNDYPENVSLPGEQGLEVWLGRRICDGVRMIHVRRDGGIKPGTSRFSLPLGDVTVHEPLQVPSIPEITERMGLPHINGQQMQLASLRPDGPGWQVTFRVRIGMFVYDLDFHWVPSTPLAAFQLTATNSHSDRSEMFCGAPAIDMRFRTPGGIDRAIVAHPADWLPTHYGPNQAQTYMGVLYWLLLPSTIQDQLDAGTLLWSPPVLFDSSHETSWPPFGKMNELPPAYSGFAQWARLKEAVGRLQGTWAESPIGPANFPGQTGETDGYTNDGEEAATADCCYYVQLLRLAGLYESRHPENFLEANGELVTTTSRPNLKTWAGIPGGPWPNNPYHSDLLGKVPDPANGYCYPAAWNYPGNCFSFDDQHFHVQTLAAAYRLTGLPAMQRTLRARALNLMSNLSPDMSARAVGWTSQAAALIWRNLEDVEEARAFRSWWTRRIDAVDSTCRKPIAHPGYWHTVRGSVFDGAEYVSAFEYGIAALGLSGAFEVSGDMRLRSLALQAGLLLVRHAWEEQPDDTLSSWAYLRPSADGQSFAAKANPGMYDEWLAAGACAVLRYHLAYGHVTADDVRKATRIRDQQRERSLRLGRPVEWQF